MSWAQWPQTAVPQPPPTPSNSVANSEAPAVPAPTPSGVSYSPGIPPPTSYTPAQFAALSPEQQYAIQQNWQQWQTYHQQYAQWHAQYGEQYQREMQAKLGMVAPTLPFVPPMPPYAAPIPPVAPASYSVPPPPPTQTTSSMNTPNISAAASQPPPPPPPLDESGEKKPPTSENQNVDLIPPGPGIVSASASSQDLVSAHQNINQGNRNQMQAQQQQQPPQQYQQQQQLPEQLPQQQIQIQQQRSYQQQHHQQQQQQQQQYQQSQQWKSNSDSRNYNERRNYGGNDRNRNSYGDNYNNRNARDRGRFDNDNRDNRGRSNPWQSGQQSFNQQSFNQQSFHQQTFNQQSQDQQHFNQPPLNQNSNEQPSEKQNPTQGDDDEKTPEERAFDEQFKKWEEEFENWKRQNANHPDKKAYKEYEMKFEDCRRKLLERRELMRKRKLERKLKEEQERKMIEEQERNQNIKCEPEKNINMTSEENVKEPDEKLKEGEKTLRSERPSDHTEEKVVEKIEDKEELKQEEQTTEPCKEIAPENVGPEKVVEFLKTTKSDGIPGLDLVSNSEEKPSDSKIDDDITEVIDLEADIKGERTEEKRITSEPRFEPKEGMKEMSSMIPSHTQMTFTANITESPQGKREIPSLLSQKFEKPVMSPPDNGPNMAYDKNNTQQEISNVFNQQKPIETFGKFLESNIAPSATTNPIGDEQSNFSQLNSEVGDKGNIPAGIAELANALSDPNVLALITAAIGNTGGPGGVANMNPNMAQDNQGGQQRISPWATGQEPFQHQNPMFQNQNQSFRGLQQGGNFRDFGGNHNNANMWNDNSSNTNSPWANRNMGDNRGNLNPWQNRPGRHDDFRRGGNQNWQNNRDFGDRKNNLWQDDIDMRSNAAFERNTFSTDVVDDRSRSSERNPDRERSNPFKDRDDRGGGRVNPFAADNKDRGRGQDRRDRSRSGHRDSRDRSRSSGRSGRQEENSTPGFHRNPFKTEPNIFDKPLDSPNTARSNLQHGGNEDYFRPAHVIDYQNKPLGGDSNAGDVLLPRKVVDYGHKPSGGGGDQGDNKDFFPMKTIDYGHSSAKPDCEENNEGRNNDFFEGRNRNRNRNRNKKKSGLQESNPTYPGPWLLLNEASRQRPGLPTKRGKRRKSLNGENNMSISLITPEFGTNSFSTQPTTNESHENFEEISEDDNDFDESESARPSDKEELQAVATPVSEDEKPVPVFPIKEITPLPEIQKKVQLIVPTMENNNTITIDEILLKPGRESRPKKIVIILRGPPGSGKSYVAKLIKEKEVEMGGSAPRLLSIDDYFMTEVDKEEKCPKSGRKVTTKEMIYEYEKEMEDSYMQYLIKAFKKTINDRLFDFVIVDCVNYSLRTFTEFYNNAKSAQFTPYTIDLLCDLETCLSRNIHNRSKEDIQTILTNWVPTPDHYIKLDITSLLQSAAIQEVEMEDISDMEEEITDESETDIFGENSDEMGIFLKSKWDTDATEEKLARLDGTSKPLQKSTTLEDYLQMDGWEPPPSSSNKKRVRWADIEEKRAQDKMRAIGFVVGHTDWNRMMDPTGGSSALTKTKYIEKVNKRK